MSEDYKNKFGMTNILTDEEKAKYSTFAAKVREMNHKDLFRLYTNTADELTTEMQDIVAFEIKIREWKALKSKNIDPKIAFSVESTQKKAMEVAERDYYDNIGDPVLAKMAENDKTTIKYRLEERSKLDGMTMENLERAQQILDANPTVVKKNMLHDKNGGGVNMMAKKYIVEDDNGDQILINNAKVQEHFRNMYIKRLSEVTGFDYTQYNEALGLDLSTSAGELSRSVGKDDDFGWNPTNFEEKSVDLNDREVRPSINMNDYEDD